MVQSLCCQLWFKLSASFTVTAQSWFGQTSVCRFEGLACAELLFSSHAALLAHWASSRRERGSKQRRLPFPSAGSQVEMPILQAFWVVLDFPSAERQLGRDECDRCRCLQGRARGPFSEGLFPWLAWLQLLPVLFEERHLASPNSLPRMHYVRCKPAGHV